MISEAKYTAISNRWHTMLRNKERAAANAGGSWNHAYKAWKGEVNPYRWSRFIGRIQAAERAEVRFAIHTERVTRALASEVEQFIGGIAA